MPEPEPMTLDDLATLVAEAMELHPDAPRVRVQLAVRAYDADGDFCGVQRAWLRSFSLTSPAIPEDAQVELRGF